VLIFKNKFRNKNHDFCPFCGKIEDPYYEINPYEGKIEFEVAKEETEHSELKDLYDINEEDWLLP